MQARRKTLGSGGDCGRLEHRPAQLAAAPPRPQTAHSSVTSPPSLATLAGLGLSPRHPTGLRGEDEAPRSNTLETFAAVFCCVAHRPSQPCWISAPGPSLRLAGLLPPQPRRLRLPSSPRTLHCGEGLPHKPIHY